jgi:hypothetical protein
VPVRADDGDLLEAVPAPDLEVVGVVPGSDLERARAEVAPDVVVGDDRHLAPDERHHGAAADEVAVALVVGMHSDRGVAEHCLDPGGGHHDVWLEVVERAVAE